MFEVVPEPEFSAWFEALPDPFAEEVAAAVDLTASSCAALLPDRLRRTLLWYDGTGTGSALFDAAGRQVELRELPAQHLRDYLGWHQEVVLSLESAVFRERLARLEAQMAELALAQLEHLKRRLRAARLSSAYDAWRHGLRQSLPAVPSDWASVRDAFTELLSLMGLESRHVLGSASGLRELTIGNVRPALRVLFGLDFPAKRLIAILGEPLDRSYYGDSVRRAERRWQAYVTAQAEDLEQRAR